MRALMTTTMAASALAIGFGMNAAQSLPLGGKIAPPDSAVQQVQQDKGPGGGGGPRSGMGSPGRGGPSMQDGGGGRMRGDGGGMREGGAQFRSGERGMRGDGGARLRSTERGGRGGAEFGYTERGGRYIERDRDRRRFGGRRGVYIERGYGYLPTGCAWLRQRALETDSPYWWRRYRACRGY